MPLELEIWDPAGRKCHGAMIRSEQVQIPCSLLGGPGIYILRMTGNTGTACRKLIVN